MVSTARGGGCEADDVHAGEASAQVAVFVTRLDQACEFGDTPLVVAATVAVGRDGDARLRFEQEPEQAALQRRRLPERFDTAPISVAARSRPRCSRASLYGMRRSAGSAAMRTVPLAPKCVVVVDVDGRAEALERGWSSIEQLLLGGSPACRARCAVRLVPRRAALGEVERLSRAEGRPRRSARRARGRTGLEVGGRAPANRNR